MIGFCSGFRFGESCVYQLLGIVNNVYKALGSREVRDFSLYLFKAFDRYWYVNVSTKGLNSKFFADDAPLFLVVRDLAVKIGSPERTNQLNNSALSDKIELYKRQHTVQC